MIDMLNFREMFDNKLSAIYSGVVVDNDDPLKLSRVRVQIRELNYGIPINKLPWYVVFYNIDGSINTTGRIPSLDANVLVEFPDCDIYNGVVKYHLADTPPMKRI